MSESRFEEFRKLVLEEDSLQKELRDLTDRNEFIMRLVALGNERGYAFTSGEVESALRAGRTWKAIVT